MPTDLDRRMAAAMAALTGEGGPLALGSIERFGTALPTIAAAPPSLPAYFARCCAEHGDRTFLVAGAERLTFAEVYEAAGRVARALVAGFGLARGDRVGIAMRNSPSWIVAYMGIVMAGGVATLLNGRWRAGELREACRDVGCTLVFADAARAALLDGGVRTIAIDDTRPLAAALAGVTAHERAETALPAVGPDDDATILFTSGSTGRSKGALSDHRAVTQAAFGYLAQAMMMRALASGDGKPPPGQPATLLNLPLFHVTGAVTAMLQSFALGRKLVLMPRWDAEEAMRLIEAERVTMFLGVPLMSVEMMTHPLRSQYDLSSVTDFSASGAPQPVGHVRRLAAAMGGAPRIGYGLTESNALGTANWRGNYLAKPTSVGLPARPLVELAILDDAGAPVAPGTRGEVAMRSVCTFKRYWNDEAATAAAFTADGFLRTGDLGHLDEDGYLFIVDRRKDIIIRGGENISCQEVEAALYEHPGVAEAAVFALPHRRFGEVPGAVVHLAGAAGARPADLLAWLDERIAAFKVPQRLWLSPTALPRLGTEKIDRLALRERYRALALDEAA